MIIADYPPQQKEMFSLIRNIVYSDDAYNLFKYRPHIEWPFEPVLEKKNLTRSWIRVSLTVAGDQISGHRLNKKRYERFGVLGIQFFISVLDPNAYTNCHAVGSAISEQLKKYIGSEISYSNVRLSPVPSEPNYFRLNLIADYSYYHFI